MAVPRNRSSNQRKRTKRAHHALSKKQPATCANCGNYRLSHAVCHSCGHYKGRAVLRMAESNS